MTMTDIAYTTLLLTALIDLCAMLRIDTNGLRISNYSNSRYYSSLRENDEFTSPKRLIPLVVLIACCTTMASMSWIVVIILAALLLIQAIALLLNKSRQPAGFNKRTARLYITALIITVVAVGGVFYAALRFSKSDAAQAAAFLAVMILTTSPLLAMLSNWLLRPFEKQGNAAAGDEKNNI